MGGIYFYWCGISTFVLALSHAKLCISLQIISAKGELDSSRALKEAADTIATPTALQLRYLQTLNTIAAERGSTIMFPIPMEIMVRPASCRPLYPCISLRVDLCVYTVSPFPTESSFQISVLQCISSKWKE